MTPSRSSRGFGDYLRAAFNARPLGMFVAPNWVGLGAFALLGAALNPGFWVLGAGIELGYLAVLATNARFQRLVDATGQSVTDDAWQKQLDTLVASLSEPDRRRYMLLEARCRSILNQQQISQTGGAVDHGLESQGVSLSRLTWMYLRLLVTRQEIEKVVRPQGPGDDLETRVRNLEKQLADITLSESVRGSLTSQIEILKQRIEKRGEAREKMAFIDAELARISEQVELIREQAVLTTDPALLSQRIDEIATTLGGTAEWIREQQRLYGAMQDLLVEPPPMSAAPRARESQ